ncbi:hypothetical protein L1887_48429 [Cichorium endivia]|nr:hypothetical protein L1887_48429 [Cichorium endivia]
MAMRSESIGPLGDAIHGVRAVACTAATRLADAGAPRVCLVATLALPLRLLLSLLLFLYIEDVQLSCLTPCALQRRKYSRTSPHTSTEVAAAPLTCACLA